MIHSILGNRQIEAWGGQLGHVANRLNKILTHNTSRHLIFRQAAGSILGRELFIAKKGLGVYPPIG